MQTKKHWKHQQGLYCAIVTLNWVYWLVCLKMQRNNFLDSVTPWHRLSLVFSFSAFAFKEFSFPASPDLIQNLLLLLQLQWALENTQVDTAYMFLKFVSHFSIAL